METHLTRKPPPHTQESKIEAMLDRVLEGQQNMMVDFNGKIDFVYNNLVGTKIRTVDFRLNKESMRILVSQRSRISANTTRQVIRTRNNDDKR